MSSYLNIYLKSNDDKDILIDSYGSTDDIYMLFREELGWSTEIKGITSENMNILISTIDARIIKSTRKLDIIKEYAYGNMKLVDEILELDEYVEKLNDIKNQLLLIDKLITNSYDSDIYDFNAVTYNFD